MNAEQFALFMETMKQLSLGGNGNVPDVTNEALASSINARLAEFEYNEDEDSTFDSWLERYGKIIEEDGKCLNEAAKVRLLVGKLKSLEFRKYKDSVKPKGPYDLTYVETVAQLKLLFAPTKSLVARRFELFKIKRSQGQDLQSYFSKLNACIELAQPPLQGKDLKCLLFIAGLGNEPRDQELQSICLRMMETAAVQKQTIGCRRHD